MCYPRGSRAASKYVGTPRFYQQAVRRLSQVSLQKSYACTLSESLVGELKVTLIKLKAEQWNDRGCKCHCCAISSNYQLIRLSPSLVRAVKRQLCIPLPAKWHIVVNV